jgi:myo-inositol 2-dehydrogenase / D-chiro-inositol 1-dehydrogenase
VHARRLTQTSTVDSVVVADVVVDRAERLAASLNCEAVPVERLIASRPTGVIIAAGTDGHADLVDLCVAHGIPCLWEKPLAPDRFPDVRPAYAYGLILVPKRVGSSESAGSASRRAGLLRPGCSAPVKVERPAGRISCQVKPGWS